MLKLIRAYCVRLAKCRTFWICLLLMAVTGLTFDLPFQKYSYDVLEETLYASSLFVPFLSAVFCAVFIGSEISSGIVKNKIVVGAKRYEIYLSELALCSVGGIAMHLAYMLPIIGRALLHGTTSSESFAKYAYMIFCMFAISVSFTSIFTFVAMLSKSRAVSVAICVVLILVLLIGGLIIAYSLEEPEIIDRYLGYTVIENGVERELQKGDPNPYYISGARRVVYSILNDYLPGGQIWTASYVMWMPLRCAVFSAVTTTAGILLFRRKNIK